MEIDDAIAIAQQAALSGQPPHAILQLVFTQIAPRYPGHIPWIDLEWCLVKAFNVPLRVARDIEGWTGIFPNGIFSNHDIDVVLEPWIRRYRESCES